MFGFFRKKNDAAQEPSYDPLNIKVSDLRTAWAFDYDESHWEVLEEFELNWGGEQFSLGYTVVNEDGNELYLEVSSGRSLRIRMYNFLDFNELPNAPQLQDEIVETGKGPASLFFEDKTFQRQSIRPCFFRNLKETDRKEHLVLEYFHAESGDYLRIEQVGEFEFDLFLGWDIAETEISNILPASA